MDKITCRTCRYRSRCIERSRRYPCKAYQREWEDKHEVLDEDWNAFNGIRNTGLSIGMVVALYFIFSALAVMERGYLTYGGECLAAVVVGVVTYCFFNGGNKHGILS